MWRNEPLQGASEVCGGCGRAIFQLFDGLLQSPAPMDVIAAACGREPLPLCYNFFTDCVEDWARKRPDAPALWCIREDGCESRYTFAEVAAKGRRVSAALHELGIRRGDRVIIILQRVPQWWFCMMGLIRLGAVPVPGTPLLQEKDIAYRLDYSGAKAIITDADGAAKVPHYDGIKLIVGSECDGWTNLDTAVAAAPADVAVEPTLATDAGIVYFSSGTSGDAKMVLHSQVSYGLAHAITGGLWLDLKPSDVVWALADTGWGKTAWSNFYGPWLMGACVFVMDMRGKFDPNVILRVLCDYPISVFCAPATALRLLVRKELSNYKFKALRHCVSAGESLNVPVYQTWLAATGLPVYEGYGQTETVLLIANLKYRNEPIRPGSMGKPCPGFDVQIVDNHGRPVLPGVEGNIGVRISERRPVGFMSEYWKNPQETADRVVNGFYLTGDTARMDADGYFWFCGRSDDIINSSSYRIGPSEVEDAVLSHPAVLECAAIGVPDEMRGEVVKAFVVLRPEFEASDHLRHDIQTHCKKVTAPYKYPRQIEFIESLPKTVSGKTRRVALRQMELQRRTQAAEAVSS